MMNRGIQVSRSHLWRMKLLRAKRIRSRCGAILNWAVLAFVFVGLTLVRSPTFIIPPTDPANPVTVYVVDYGYHSSLVLPDRDGELIEYAYGDWRYFALNQRDFSNAAAALLIPTQSTLGRQKFSDVAELQQFIAQYPDVRLLSFEVAAAKAAHLLKLLNERFNRNIDSCVENPLTGLFLVKDDQDYTLFHNSNQELVEWIEDLDCKVRGFFLLPNLQMKYPEDESEQRG